MSRFHAKKDNRSCLAECVSCVAYGVNEGFNDLGVFELVTRWDFDWFGLRMVLCFEYFTVFGFDTYDKYDMSWFSESDHACNCVHILRLIEILICTFNPKSLVVFTFKPISCKNDILTPKLDNLHFKA